MSKKYSEESFSVKSPNGVIVFNCWTTDTRSGFCHTVYCCFDGKTSKVSYLNRTWENYRYQTALHRAFDKLPKYERALCYAWDELKVKRNHEDCEKFVSAFKAAYDAVPTSVKNKLAESDTTIETKEQADAMLGFLQIAAILGE